MEHEQDGGAVWRDMQRKDLIARRQSIPVAARHEADTRLSDRLDRLIGDVSGRIISLYWPFRGEPDLRRWADGCRARGATLGLPVVIAKATPLEFREWQNGVTLERGVWKIPIPPASAKVVLPDIVIAPVVGLDAQNYRLGYGAGFFDRTIAALRKIKEAQVIGVGYEMQRMETIHPHQYDIPMDEAILERT